MAASSLGAATLRGVAFHRDGSPLSSGRALRCCRTESCGLERVGPSWVLEPAPEAAAKGVGFDSHIRAHIKHLPSQVWGASRSILLLLQR